jgi:Stage II sporulation protein E (SpoIIE)
LGEYVRPQDGETLSGDVVLTQREETGVLAAVIDVLGHGPAAHEVGVRLCDALSQWAHATAAPEPEGAMRVLHDSARGTRGAVAAVAWLDADSLEGWVAGIGNARCRIFGECTKTVEFGDGVLGQRVRSPRPHDLRLRPSDFIVLFSDGIRGRFGTENYPSIGLDPASTIALNVVRRFGKGLDDASCAVIRCK